MTAFELDRFVEECRAALQEGDARSAVEEVVRSAVAQPSQVIAALGEPRSVTTDVLYAAPDLSIFNVLWGPDMDFYPHDHNMWAVIGVYGGREDNAFYRRRDDGLERHGVKEVGAGEILSLGESVIHSVATPGGGITAGIHVYGGDLTKAARSEWDPATFEERPFDDERSQRIFDEANERFQSSA